MGISVLHDPDENQSVMYCNTTDVAFGPIIDGDQDVAYAFVDFVKEKTGKDAREGGLDLTGLLLDFEKEHEDGDSLS